MVDLKPYDKSGPNGGSVGDDIHAYNGIFNGDVNGISQIRKTKRLILIRHGETDYNAQKRVQGRGIDAELNENGRKQAELLAERLKDEKIDFFASSSLIRAQQTAEAVFARHKDRLKPSAKIHLYDGLQEMGFGPQFEGKVFDKESANKPGTIYKELLHMIKQWEDGNFTFQSPGGESALQVETRSRHAIDQILSLKDQNDQPFEHHHPDEVETFAIVCHGRLLKILLCSLMDIGLEKMEKFAQNNTAVNVLEYDGCSKSFTAILFNCTAHLDKQPNN